MKTITPPKLTQSAVLNGLLHHHRQFQIYLDSVATDRDLDASDIDVLIQVRQFNVDCTARYSDLIAQTDIRIKPSSARPVGRMRMYNQNPMVLNDINRHLSLLLPAYRRALSNRALTGFARVIVGSNYEKIVDIKDNLLHPLPEAFYA